MAEMSSGFSSVKLKIFRILLLKMAELLGGTTFNFFKVDFLGLISFKKFVKNQNINLEFLTCGQNYKWV